jgi:hypothetical protein
MGLLIGLLMAFFTSTTSLLALVGAPTARGSYTLFVFLGWMIVRVWRSSVLSVDSSFSGVLRGKCSFKCASSTCLSAPLHSFAELLATHWSTGRRASSLIVILPVPNGTARRSQHTHALDSRAACMSVNMHRRAACMSVYMHSRAACMTVYMHSRAACMNVHVSSDSAQGCGASVTCVYGLCFLGNPLTRVDVCKICSDGNVKAHFDAHFASHQTPCSRADGNEPYLCTAGVDCS